MADEPFDVSADPAQGQVLTPADGIAAPTPTDVGILPDVANVLGPRPQLPLPPPPPPPPSPLQDPRQQLLALAALGMALGQGPRGGGAGALQGFSDASQQMHQEQLGRWQQIVQQNQRDQALVVGQQRAVDQDYLKRENALKQTLINFKTASSKVGSKAEYDALADSYGNLLRASGYRTMSPDWLRANIPYMQPSESSTATKAFADWMKNPNNKRLLDENPQVALNSLVEVDLNGDGVKERFPLAQLAEKAGQSFAHDATGFIAVPKTPGGTSAFDVKYQALLSQFRAENRREPNPKENNGLVDQAIVASKEKPEPTADDALVALSPAGLDAAALQYAKTGQLPAMGLSKNGASTRSKIINRAADLYPNLDVAANKAGFAADEGSLKAIQKQRDAVVAFESTATQNLDRFIAQASQVPDTKIPLLNKPYRQIRRQILGDTDLAGFDAARLAAQNEIAKVLNSANLSGQLTDNARHEMQQALDPNATSAQLVAAAKILKADMATRRQSYDTQLAEIQSRVKRVPGQAPTVPTTPLPSRFTIVPKGGG